MSLVNNSVCFLKVPYYDINETASLAHAFKYVGNNFVGNVIGFGALLSLSASKFSFFYPLPRILYSMAMDGLVFKWFSGKAKIKLRGMHT